MLSTLEFVCLKKSQISGALISGIIADNLLNCQTNLSTNNQYNPLQASLKLLSKIVDLTPENEPILTENFIELLAEFNESEMTIALFPLIIYCYQNSSKLEDELERIIKHNKWSKNITLNHLKIIAIVTYLTLKKELNLTSIITNINEKIESVNREDLKEILFIKHLIDHKLTLRQVEEQLSNNGLFFLFNRGIYQALYSFLSMNDSWEISLQRSYQFSGQQQETTVLTGLLLGLHHGYLGIPYHYRKMIDRHEKKTTSEIKNFSKQLVARWQGKLENR